MGKLLTILLVLFFGVTASKAQSPVYFEYADTAFTAGQTHVVYGILWEIEGGVARLRPDSKVYMDTLISFMQNHPDFVYEIGVHEDIRSEASYALHLSEVRADSIVSFLKSKGVTNVEIIPKGYGNAQPVITAETAGRKLDEYDHQRNRRVELRIIAIKE